MEINNLEFRLTKILQTLGTITHQIFQSVLSRTPLQIPRIPCFISITVVVVKWFGLTQGAEALPQSAGIMRPRGEWTYH